MPVNPGESGTRKMPGALDSTTWDRPPVPVMKSARAALVRFFFSRLSESPSHVQSCAMWLATSSFEVPDGLLATLITAQLNPKPHPGLQTKNPAPHPALDERNSTAAIGLRAGLALNGARQSERARYYGSALGRFISPDPGNSGAEPSDPQSWNAYSYVLNSPLSNTDPDGEDICKDGSYADACVTDTPPDPIQTLPFPQGPSQQPPTTNPAPVQPGPVFNPPGGNTGNCVAGFAAAGAGVVGAIGADVGFDLGAVAGAGAGTLVEPGGGTVVGGVAGGLGGAAFGGGLGAYYGGRFGASVGSIVCASGGGGSGAVGGATESGGSSANDNKKADDLIRGRLKASKSYHAEYGSKTYGEIKNFAKQGDRSAQQMKKLIEQGDRLMQKLGGKS